MKYGFEDSILKCQSWPVLAKHPINVYFYAILVLLDHLNNITRNQLSGLFVYLVGLFKCFSALGDRKKMRGCGLLGVSVPRLALCL